MLGKVSSHVIRELLEVCLLLGQLLLQLQQLLLLAHADGIVLVGTLTALEGIASFRVSINLVAIILKALAFSNSPAPAASAARRCRRGKWARRMIRQDRAMRDRAYPWPPAFGGAPVSPSAIARAVAVNARVELSRDGRASLVKDVRSIVASRDLERKMEGGRMGDIWRGDWPLEFNVVMQLAWRLRGSYGNPLVARRMTKLGEFEPQALHTHHGA
jgi:hypothetical protein